MSAVSSAPPIHGSTLALLSGGAVVAGLAAVILRDPELRAKIAAAATDAEMVAVIRQAVGEVGGALLASWQRHRLTDALVAAIRRTLATVRL